MKEKNFTIDAVVWHVVREPDARERTTRRLYYFARFLEENGLLEAPLVATLEDVTDDFKIDSDHLTVRGMAVVRRGYDKWMRKLDTQRIGPEDTSLLKKALAEVVAQERTQPKGE